MTPADTPAAAQPARDFVATPTGSW
jgi:hypothetical protein